MSARVLCVLGPGFEEIEAVTPVDVLRRAGAEVVLASTNADLAVTGRCGVTVRADARLDDIDAAAFDLLLVPGGPGVAALRSDGRVASLASAFVRDGKAVAAICAAPTVLHDAGLLAGRIYTAHFSVCDELTGARRDLRVADDGPIITSRGAGTALDFGLHLVRRLCGEAAAAAVADAIMA